MDSPGSPAIPPTPAINPVSQRLYVPAADGRLTVRDAVQGAILANIALSGRAIDVVVNPDTNLVYALSSGGTLDVIDGSTNLLAASLPLGHEGMAIGLNTITSRVYVGTRDGLATVDGASLTMVGFLPGVFAGADIAVDEATNRIYLSSILEQRVNVVDGFTNTLIGTVTVGDRPAGLGVDPIAHRVYVANSGTPRRADKGDSVTVIDGYRNTVAATIDLERQDALGVEVDSAAGTVSVTMSSGPPLIIDMASNRLVAADGPVGASGPTAGLAASAPSTSAAADQPAMSFPVATTPASNAPGAAAYNLTIATDASPDLTDLGSLIDSATSRWPTPREKVWALYYWTHILRRQTGPVVLHGFEVTDPVQNFNDYGFTMCSTVTGINQTLYEALGLRHQYWDICNHTVAAVEYDGRFHMIDNSMSNLVTTDDGVTLASVQEAAADAARLVRERSLYASSPNGFLTGTDSIRSVADIASPVDGSTLNGFYRDFCEASLKFRDYYYNWNAGHRYVLNLREGEAYTRSFQPLDTSPDYWISSEHVDAPDPASTFQNDAANRFGLRGNGRWSFSPALTADGWSRAAYRWSNIEPADGGLRPSAPATPSDLVYKVQAGNAIASQHIQAQFARSDARATAVVSISVNHGATWTDLGSVGTALGFVPLAVDARDQVNAAYETLVRVRMTTDGSAPDGIRLAGLTIETITQVNTKALPHLNVGRNEIYAAAGDQSETMALWPDLRGELWKKDIYASSNIAAQPETLPRRYTAVAYPAVLTQDASLTYRMEAPTDITRLVYGGRLHNYAAGSYIDFLHSFDGGATWTRSYRLSDIAKPYDVVHYETVTDIPAGARTVLFKYLLHNTNPTATRATGLYAVRMEADHRPATDPPAPVAVTFRWRELQADRTTVARSHKQLVTAYPFTYVIDVGGRDHRLGDSVTTSVAAADAGAPAGYGDGLDSGGDKYVFSRRT
ncbi:MAG: YncE family protein, partial [Acidobacteriota bacterium]